VATYLSLVKETVCTHYIWLETRA